MDIRKFINEECSKRELEFVRWYLKQKHEEGCTFEAAMLEAVKITILRRAVQCIGYAELKTPREVVYELIRK